jgi:hypothetical protein
MELLKIFKRDSLGRAPGLEKAFRLHRKQRRENEMNESRIG